MSRTIVERSVSFSDLLRAGIELVVSRVDGILQVTSGTDEGRPLNIRDLPSMLYTLGIVKDHNVVVQEKTQHRTMDGKLVEDYRFNGKERNDKKWLASGFASEEAKLSSSKMRDMVSYAGKLQNGGD